MIALRPGVREPLSTSYPLAQRRRSGLDCVMPSGDGGGRPMQIAIISDTHMPRGARALPQACIERCAGADEILHAGDLSDVAVLDMLRAIGPPVHAVHGNVDSAAVRRLLPSRLVLRLDGLRIGRSGTGTDRGYRA